MKSKDKTRDFLFEQLSLYDRFREGEVHGNIAFGLWHQELAHGYTINMHNRKIQDFQPL